MLSRSQGKAEDFMAKDANSSALRAAPWESMSASSHIEAARGRLCVAHAVTSANTDEERTIVPLPTSGSSAAEGSTYRFASLDNARWRRRLFLCKTGGTW